MSMTEAQLRHDNLIDEVSILVTQCPRIIEVIGVLFQNKEASKEDLMEQLKPILYGLSLQSDRIMNDLIKLGYQEQVCNASDIIEVNA